MKKFPIKYNNLISGIDFKGEISLGVTELKGHKNKIKNCFCKIYQNNNFYMLDIKSKELNLCLELKKINRNLYATTGNVLYYEIPEDILHEEFINSINTLRDIFQEKEFIFKFSKVKIQGKINNPIEVMKLNLYEEIYKKLYDKGINANRVQGDIYQLFLYDEMAGKDPISTWVNFDMENYENYENQEEIILTREYDLRINDKEIKLLEKIKLIENLDKEEIENTKGHIKRKLCLIFLEVMEK